MFKSVTFFYLLFITLTQSQDFTVQFPTFPADTDIGSCTCDLTANQCDVSCCCDSDCNSADKLAFGCNLEDNQFTNSTPALSTVQPTCFKNISIFQSNSPYIIQKMGELVCVDYQRSTGSEYYQQPTSQTLNGNTFLQMIDSIYSVSPSYSTPSGLTKYLVGTPIQKNDSTIFSLPTTLFGSDLCSASQTITYMNNFVSTCNQIVDSTTCSTSGALTYLNSLCLLQSPGSPNPVCINIAGIAASFNSATNSCTNALQTLTINIYYSNPTGIEFVNFNMTNNNTSSSTLQQTFVVQFIKNEPLTSLGSPGYRQGANITVGNLNNSTITSTSSPFYITQPASNGFCDSNGATTVPVGFGENVRSTCQYTVTSSNCSNTLSLLSSINITTLRVAAYANSSLSNASTDWLPIRICKSNINGPMDETCDDTYTIAGISSSCFLTLNIQIAYTNIGSIKNPQSILSAVIFHYQYSTPPPNGIIFLTKSVTFQEIPNTPIVEQGQIPTPNTRLPADFFYPFSGDIATKSMTFSFRFYLFFAFLIVNLI